MYLWRRTAEMHWLKAREDLLQTHAYGQLVIVHRPGYKRLELEIVCGSQSESFALLKQFGGRSEVLPRNWLERFARRDSKPTKIGTRLLIFNVEGTLESRLSGHKGRSHLVLPASLAFGTGEHVTTAMSLRFLEQLTRRWKAGWSLIDLAERRIRFVSAVTHELRTVQKCASRVVMLFPRARLRPDEKQILFDGPPDGLATAEDARVRQFVQGEARDRLTELKDTP